ncbi:RagB/SusD family nutrient uptake outer membrane protein [Capnocytophaga canis]|uniref:RagB/SusD family nutrient uptake outer membrane protein n=1 Tax=Capnocytophaga canis TaxID=1848903 RepID=UPI00156254CC|nr:RagB/SusD family nutrient uptake outer membrane protein [Capnocytophaga canis]
MKNKIKTTFLLLVATSLGVISCNDFLDREPLSNVTPKDFLKSELDLATYTVTRYGLFPTHSGWNAGTFIHDNGTDNQAGPGASNIWLPGEVRVPSSGGSWDFSTIRQINYFFEQVLPRYEKGEIVGDKGNIEHYIGEAYFLRAYEYFNKLTSLGDFPIITKVLPEDKGELIAASKRAPRNEVARFILSDLDKAIGLLKSAPFSNKNRINKEVALLFKSRVALYEGTWLKYHAGTARVPGGPNWPGAKSHTGFSLDVTAESNYFLDQAMNAAEQVADAVKLVESNHQTQQTKALENPYFKMFADLSMTSYSEVLMWRQYNAEFSGHHTMHYLNGGASSGYTRNFVETFLMKNGLPIYAPGSGYKGDTEIVDVRADRDERLQLFMVQPKDTLVYEGTSKPLVAPYPELLDNNERKAVTGYNVKKGVYGKGGKYLVGANPTETGCIVFRATEAYLNYIEASYERTGSLNGKATSYWQKLRSRAGLPEDPNVTIAATDLSQERDWGKYSAGNVIDATLYNIRRERRCEFIAEGMRWNDLKRWRSLDQVKNYVIEGFNLWDSMYTNYKNKEGETVLKALPESNPNVSAKSQSKYLRPYQIVKNNNKFFDGYNWTPAHYLSPIAYEHFVIASPDGTEESSVIYQNPNWPTKSGGTPLD